MHRFNNTFSKRAIAVYLTAVLVFGNTPLTAFAAVTVDAKANGQDALTLATSTDSFDVVLDAPGAVSCSATLPDGSTSNIATSTTLTIPPGHAFYPATGGSSTFSFTCDDGSGSTASDSVTVSLPGAPSVPPTVDVKANGSDGPITINPGDSYTYSWTSTNSTACQIDAPVLSNIALSGSSTPITSGSFYPTSGSPVTITVTCSDGVTNASDSVVVNMGSIGGGSSPSVDLLVNGSNGPVALNPGDTYTYSWTSANATACQVDSPVLSNIALSGSSTPIGAGSAFYPTTASSTTLTITCSDGVTNASDSVVVSLNGVGGTVPTVDVLVNGSNGPVVLNPGDTFVYSWVSANATACQLDSPVLSNIGLTGSSTPIGPGVTSFYPTLATSTTITVTCSDGVSNATDSVVVSLVGGSGTVPTVDVKANGSDGPITINPGDSYTYSWTSTNSTACQIDAPVLSNIALSGSSTPITSGSFYPTSGSPVTITVTCSDGTNNASDSVVINLASINNPPNNPGGSSGGHHHTTATASVTAQNDMTFSCPLIHDYMRSDFSNDPMELMKLQSFLKFYMGYTNVSLTGVFDQATYDAVGAFQMQYKDDILTPWGETAPTHYVYILTLKKVNEIFCQHEIPLTPDQQHEVTAFRSLIESARASGATIQYVGTVGTADTVTSTTTSSEIQSASSTTIDLPIVGQVDKGQSNENNLASVLFSFPGTLKGTVQLLYEFVLILLVLYIFGTVLKDVLYADLPENAAQRFIAKWSAITLGTLVAIVVSYFLDEYALILPLLVVLVGSATWMALYKQHPKLRQYFTKTTVKTTTTTPQPKPL